MLAKCRFVKNASGFGTGNDNNKDNSFDNNNDNLLITTNILVLLKCIFAEKRPSENDDADKDVLEQIQLVNESK